MTHSSVLRRARVLVAVVLLACVGGVAGTTLASTGICGDFAGTVTQGETRQITCDVNLTGDLIVEGVLTGVDTFTLDGNGFQILVQNGGRLDLAGKHRSAWVRWGDNVSGSPAQPDWQIGDRLAVAPTKAGIYGAPYEVTWTGDWATMVRPANSPDVPLVDGTTARPEVANLSQSIVLQDLRRLHFHEGAGVQTLKWLKVLNSGTAGVVGDYPIHFHLNGEASRGSLHEGVVVENGKNHAFVAHASHGIVYRDTAAINTFDHPYWWDLPPGGNNDDTTNDSNDIVWDHALAGYVQGSSTILSGFRLGAGIGNRLVDSAVYGVQGTINSAGATWPEKGQGVWDVSGLVSHNNVLHGIFTWQNDGRPHVDIEGITIYRVGRRGISHGAYINHYEYRQVSITGTGKEAVVSHALSLGGHSILFEDFVTDNRLAIADHKLSSGTPVIFRRSTFTGVDFYEGTGANGGITRFEDSGPWAVPSAFVIYSWRPASVIEIYEDGVLLHRWTPPPAGLPASAGWVSTPSASRVWMLAAA